MTKRAKRIETGYKPRELQAYLHNSLKRFNVLVCHRRFGKTVFSINEMIDQALRNTRINPQYAYFAPFYGQAKRVAWDYLKDFTKQIPGVTVNEAELRVDIARPNPNHISGFDRVRIMLLGADNPASIRGIYLDGGILDEFAEMDPTVWGQVIRPALSDREGWAIFIGTPKGQNDFYKIYNLALETRTEDWVPALFKASETGIISKAELEAAALTMSPEEYAQEFECSFTAALIGAYYGKLVETAEKEKRVTNVPHDPAVEVDTFWDLGIGDTTVIWFLQQVGQELHLIDYIEQSGQGLAWYVKELKKKDYTYGQHYLPHDGGARELGTGKTRQETLVLLGIRTIVLARQAIDDGIHAARMLLPKCWFDAVKCKRGIEALKNYQRKWDPKNKIFLLKPKHDWASHGADGFRTLAMGLRPNHAKMNNKKFPRQAEMEYDIFGG